ncbi:hypothetical protein L0O71_12765, partial [Clostridium cochlearium]
MEYKINFSNFIKTCLPPESEIIKSEAPFYWHHVIDAEFKDCMHEQATNLYPASIKTVKGVLWGYINSKGD